MTLVQDTCIDGVQFINAGKVDVANDGIEKKVEVIMTSSSSIQIVECSDAEEIIDIFTDFSENLEGLSNINN